jgi:hypothetical protein
MRTLAITLWFPENAYPVSLFLRNNSRAKISFCYCVSLFYLVWIYNHTVTIVIQKYRELCLISKTILIGFFILEKQFANIPDRGFLFFRNKQIIVHEYVRKTISTFKMY